jgi:hypothetical protein
VNSSVPVTEHYGNVYVYLPVHLGPAMTKQPVLGIIVVVHHGTIEEGVGVLFSSSVKNPMSVYFDEGYAFAILISTLRLIKNPVAACLT